MARVTISPLLSVVAALALAAGLFLLAVSAWSRPLVDGAEAARAGRLEDALKDYQSVSGRFEAVSPAQQVLPSIYQATIANQLQLQYYLGQYDAVIEKATVSPSTASIHFWAGCALFAKANQSDTPEQLTTFLNRAVEEFRKALEQQPEHWNTKYNYELTRRLLAELRQEGSEEEEKLLPKLLEENPAPLGPPRRVG